MTMIKLEINALNAADLLAQISALQIGSSVITGGHTAVNPPAGAQDTKENHDRDASSYEAECQELQSKLSDEQAKVATLEKSVTKLNTQLKDAEAGGEKTHKAFLAEQKRADAAEARIKELEKASDAKPAPADNATNDAAADAALDAPPADAKETEKATPAPRTQRTTRNVTKPAEETAEHKAIRETITNDLLDLGGLAETNKQVATDVEEVLEKYGITNGADLKTEQLTEAAADINELIGVYFK